MEVGLGFGGVFAETAQGLEEVSISKSRTCRVQLKRKRQDMHRPTEESNESFQVQLAIQL